MKKIFSNLLTKKSLSIVLIVLLALTVFVSISGVAKAAVPVATAPTQPPSAWSCLRGSIATCMVTYATYFVSQLFDLFILLGAWLVDIGLSLSNKVYNNNAVQSGFGVTLSIANLGFVLAIIIIAIATILRNETYGYKKALWKLVVMAILINFGLVITAPIIGFANGMTSYFENSIVSNGANGVKGISNFTTQIARKLQVGASNQGPTLNPKDSPSGSFSQSLLSAVFLIVFKFIVVMAFFEIGVMLFLRFIWLAILLILLPFAWLMWIFPNFHGRFSEWWEKFIHWTFFSPAAMFFIWLAIGISHGFVSSTQVGNSAGAALASATGLSPTVDQLASNIVTVGVLIGGLMAASKLSGQAGSFAVTQAKAASNSIQGYVGKGRKAATDYAGTKANRVIGDRLRGMGRRTDVNGETTTWLQRRGASLQGTIGLRAVGAKIAKTGSTEAMHKDKEEEIKKYIDHNLKSLTNEGLLKRAESDSFLDQTESAAIGQELAKRHLTTNARVAPKMDQYIETMGIMGNLKNEDTLKSLDNGQLSRAANSPNAFISDAQAAAIGQEIAKRNMTTETTIAPLMARFIEAAQHVGKAQDILNNRPDLVVPRPGETRDVALLRAVRGIKDIVQIDHRMLDFTNAATNRLNPSEVMDVALHLGNGQINKIASDGTTQQQANLRATIIDISNRFTSGALALSNDQQDQLNRIIELYDKNPLLQRI